MTRLNARSIDSETKTRNNGPFGIFILSTSSENRHASLLGSSELSCYGERSFRLFFFSILTLLNITLSRIHVYTRENRVRNEIYGPARPPLAPNTYTHARTCISVYVRDEREIRKCRLACEYPTELLIRT